MARYCGNCGTEVDDTAVFCPTCGAPIDEVAADQIPPAPAWPEPTGNARDEATAYEPPSDAPEPEERYAAEAEPEAEADPEETPASRWGYAAPAREGPAGRDPWAADEPADAPTRFEQRPAPEEPSVPPPIPAATGRERGPLPRSAGRPAESAPGSPTTGGVDLPFRAPVTLSGWLIGIGALLAVVGLVVIFVTEAVNVIDLLLLVGMLGVAATVFLAAQMSAIPNLRLISLVISVLAFGVALDRIAVTGGGAGELLLFLGSAAAGIGAIVAEVGQDQPLGPSC